MYSPALQETSGDNRPPLQDEMANKEREKLAKENTAPTSHTPLMAIGTNRVSLGSGNKKVTE